MPSQEHETLVAALRAGGGVAAPTLADQRAGYDAMLSANPRPADVTITELTVAGCKADWVTVPATANSSKAILYLHGGGYMIGSNVGYREFAGRLSRATGARVLVLDYRLAPEHPFPAAVEDATAAYRWLLSEGYAPANITIAGDSAGGGLAIATLVNVRDSGGPLPAGGVCLSPWTDLAASGDSAKPGAVDDPLVALEGLQAMSSAYAPGAMAHPLASPLFADPKGLPPLLVLVGTREILYDDATRFVAKAKAAGVGIEYFEGKDLVHVWPVLAPTAPESIDALQRIARFMG